MSQPDASKPQSVSSMRRVGPIVWYSGDGVFWLRAFGKGFHLRDAAKHPLHFSERNGYSSFWTFRWLR